MKLRLPCLAERQLEKLDAWLRSVLWESTLPKLTPSAERSSDTDLTTGNFEIHRLKALVPVIDDESSSQNGVEQAPGKAKETSVKMKMVQGVRDVFEITTLPDAPDEGEGDGEGAPVKEGKMVLIGRDLGDATVWQKSLDESIH